MSESSTGDHRSGGYERDTSYLDDRILDPRHDDVKWPVEAGRYRLVAARACPWANRSIIVRRLLGLEGAISMGLVGPVHDDRSWTFHLDDGGLDPVLGIHHLRDAYERRQPGYAKGVTVPAIVDVPSGQVVTNDFAQITIDLSLQWTAHHRDGAPDLYPAHRRDEIDDVNQSVYHDVNNAVYEAGFAKAQGAYENAYRRLFGQLDRLSDRLASRRYLVGDTITEADVRLFTTLVRFDAVYHGHFKCNRSKLAEMPVLWAYARDLFQTPGFGDTIDFDQIKAHYYCVHTTINPTQIVPVGPDPTGWLAPHSRDELGGRPFGDGAPPAPPTPSERVPPLVAG